MKTPQEEAESLANAVASNHFSPGAMTGPSIGWLKNEILDEIPLAQLIAVARAAKKVVQNADGELLIDTYFNADGAELLAALQSLRATGKVTL